MLQETYLLLAKFYQLEAIIAVQRGAFSAMPPLVASGRRRSAGAAAQQIWRGTACGTPRKCERQQTQRQGV